MEWKTALESRIIPYIQQYRQNQRVGLITDFDGTVSQIVQVPSAAMLTSTNRHWLQALTDQLTLVALVSGRGVLDLQQRANIHGAVYVGNHGMERINGDGQVEIPAEVRAYRPQLDALIQTLSSLNFPKGVHLEDKGATLSIHYRQTEDPSAVSERYGAQVQALTQQHGLEYFTGRMIFEVRPPVAIDKGTAFRALVTRYRLDAVIFLGDDVTDSHAMIAARQMREAGECYGLAGAVLSSHTPNVVRDNADVWFQGVGDVEGFLAWLNASLATAAIGTSSSSSNSA